MKIARSTPADCPFASRIIAGRTPLMEFMTDASSRAAATFFGSASVTIGIRASPLRTIATGGSSVLLKTAGGVRSSARNTAQNISETKFMRILYQKLRALLRRYRTVRHSDWTNKVVCHHHCKEHGTSPVYCSQAVRGAACGLDSAGRVNEKVDRASAQYSAGYDRRDIGCVPDYYPEHFGAGDDADNEKSRHLSQGAGP